MGKIRQQPLSKEEINILKKFQQLDPLGKSTISFLLDREVSRVRFSRAASERINELEGMIVQDVDWDISEDVLS